MKVHWKIPFQGGVIKNQDNGGGFRKKIGLGQFSDLRESMARKIDWGF